MRIVVIVKEVADTEARIALKDGLPDLSDTKMVANPYDEYAIEEAIAKAKELDAATTAVMIGSEQSQESLRRALAMGIDEAILLTDPAMTGADPLQVAKVLKAIIEPLEPTFIIGGRQGVDYDWGLAAIALAEEFGWAHVGLIGKLDVTDGKFRCETEGDDGRQVVEGNLPAVFTADKSLNEPRLPNLIGIRKAKKKPLEQKTLADYGLDGAEVGGSAAQVKLVSAEHPPKKEGGRMIEGESAAEKAANLIKALREEAKVI